MTVMVPLYPAAAWVSKAVGRQWMPASFFITALTSTIMRQIMRDAAAFSILISETLTSYGIVAGRGQKTPDRTAWRQKR
jgi:hypothetical protein